MVFSLDYGLKTAKEGPMKIFKKVAIIGGIAFVVIVLAIGIAIKVFVDKDLVAKLIEDNINGRVEIEDISVPLWAAFSGITIDGFKIGYKDAEMKKNGEN